MVESESIYDFLFVGNVDHLHFFAEVALFSLKISI